VARRVDEIQLVLAAIAGTVTERHALRLDGDAALAFDIHRVEDLRAHLALAEATAMLDEAVGERRFAVVDVGDD